MSTDARHLRRERAINWLRQHPMSTAAEMAEAIHCVVRHAQYLLNRLRADGLVHVGAWRKHHGTGASGRVPTRLWCAGFGHDAPRPPRDTWQQIRTRRAARLREQYGRTIAYKIMESRRGGGASVLVLDGETVYRRGKPRGRNGGRRAAAITGYRR